MLILFFLFGPACLSWWSYYKHFVHCTLWYSSILSLYLVILKFQTEPFIKIYRSWLFSCFSLLQRYSISFSTLIHLLCCSFHPHWTRVCNVFSTTITSDWIHNCHGIWYFNQHFKSWLFIDIHGLILTPYLNIILVSYTYFNALRINSDFVSNETSHQKVCFIC